MVVICVQETLQEGINCALLLGSLVLGTETEKYHTICLFSLDPLACLALRVRALKPAWALPQRQLFNALVLHCRRYVFACLWARERFYRHASSRVAQLIDSKQRHWACFWLSSHSSATAVLWAVLSSFDDPLTGYAIYPTSTVDNVKQKIKSEKKRNSTNL